MKKYIILALNRNRRFLIQSFLLLTTSLLLGCGQEIAVEEITEEQINQIIDEMPEVKPTVVMTIEDKEKRKSKNLKERKDNVEKATGFTIREYKDYWILENVEEGFGLRLPYDTGFFSEENVTNYTTIYRPKTSSPDDKSLSCASEMYIHTGKRFKEWLEEEKSNYEILEENQKNINNKNIFWDTAKSEFDAIYGTAVIEGNNYLYVFVNPFHENNICKNTHQEIINSYFSIP